MWQRIENLPIPVEKKWTVSNESRYQRLKNGDISEAKDTSLFKKAFSRKCRLIDNQGKFLGEAEQFRLRHEIILMQSRKVSRMELNSQQHALNIIQMTILKMMTISHLNL